MTAAWNCAGLLISKKAQQFNGSGGEYLRSHGFDIVSLNTFASDIHGLVCELWTRVSNLNSAGLGPKRPSDAPIASSIEAACLAAVHWPALGLHLANTLLAVGLPSDIEAALWSRCLKIFSDLMQSLTENTMPFKVEEDLKMEIFTRIFKSDITERILWGCVSFCVHLFMQIYWPIIATWSFSSQLV